MKHRYPYYPLLTVLLDEAGIYARDIAPVWGLSEKSTNRRLRGDAPIPVEDAIALQERYFPEHSVNSLFGLRLHKEATP